MWSAYVCNRYCLVMFGHWIIFYLFGSDVSDCLPSRAISKLSRRGQPREDLESWQKIMKAYQISPHPGFVRSMLDICILYVITSYHINLWSIYILFIDCIIYQNIPEIQIQHWCCFTILCTSQGTLAAQGQSSLILRDFLKASQPTILASTICSPATPTGEECEKKKFWCCNQGAWNHKYSTSLLRAQWWKWSSLVNRIGREKMQAMVGFIL